MWTHMLICPDNHFSCLDKGYYKYISSHHHCYQPDIPKGNVGESILTISACASSLLSYKIIYTKI